MAAVYEDLGLIDRADDAKPDVWASIARAYAAFGSPFVPCDEDIAAFEQALAMHAAGRDVVGLDAVVLGVTPALVNMRWPRGTRICAVEISPHVIDALWPGDIPDKRRAICASWLATPLERRTFDVVVGDGSLATCRYPCGMAALARSARDLLAEDGLFVFRSYLRPQVQESIEAVFDALLRAPGMSVDCFKMRLYLAMQKSPEEGIAVKDAARLLDEFGVDRQVMRHELGWSNATIEPFSAWRTSDAVYSFPTLDELRQVLAPFFEEVSVSHPRYELGHCCPTVAMRARRIRGRESCA
jgi:SAM-dependent methyltransferase